MAAINIVEQAGYRLLDGADINTIIQAVNGIAAGTTAGTYSGTFTGSFRALVAANTLTLKQGANGKTGTVTLNGVTPISVANTSITANSVVVFTLKTVGGTVSPNAPNVLTITPSTGFTVGGTASDTSVYNYVVLESAA